MNKYVKAILMHMLNHKYIGKRHTPENKLIKSKTKWIDAESAKTFDKDYKKMINEGYIIKQKKKTGKGQDWHISLNPKRVKDLRQILDLR